MAVPEEVRQRMKHNTGLFFRFIAILVVIFIGITAIIPQSTAPENDEGLPVWTDVTEDSRDYIRTVYKNYLMDVKGGNSFGVDLPLTTGETAYISVALYEALNGSSRSFEEHSGERDAEYIKKATEYGIWNETLGTETRNMTREDLCLAIDPLVSEKVSSDILLPQSEVYKSPEIVTSLYSVGITPTARINAAYSPWIDATREDAAKVYAMIIDPSLRIRAEEKDFSLLETRLKDTMSQWNGDWSLYFEDYETGQSISINSHQVYSASLIKMFIAYALYDGMEKGTISENGSVTDHIRKMITYSDNDSWSYLARVLGGGVYSRGMAKMTDVAQANGFKDTGTFYKGTHRNFNFTSVNDCGAFLSRLLDGGIVSREYSKKLLDLLKAQQHLHKIPSGIPDNIVTANKTGELDYIQGDAAIVYAPAGTYILVIIGDSLTNSYGQVDKFTTLSKMVYDYLHLEENNS